jgi:hypothetical protein
MSCLFSFVLIRRLLAQRLRAARALESVAARRLSAIPFLQADLSRGWSATDRTDSAASMATRFLETSRFALRYRLKPVRIQTLSPIRTWRVPASAVDVTIQENISVFCLLFMELLILKKLVTTNFKFPRVHTRCTNPVVYITYKTEADDYVELS